MNHSSHRPIINDVNGMSDSTETESLDDQSLTPIEPDRAPHQRHGYPWRTVITLSSSGHGVTISLAAPTKAEAQMSNTASAQVPGL